MKYSEQNPKEIELFQRANFIGSSIDLEQFFGPIDLLPSEIFSQLYVGRQAKQIQREMSRIFSDVSKYNRNNWISPEDLGPSSNDFLSNKSLQGVFKIVSPIGTGKSTFIKYLTGYHFTKKFKTTNFYTLCFDFRNVLVTSKRIDGDHLASELLDQIFGIEEIFGDLKNTDNYYNNRYPIELATWASELNSSGISPQRYSASSEEYKEQHRVFAKKREKPLDALCSYLEVICARNTKDRFFVVIDNIDHYSNLNPEIVSSLVATLHRRFFSKKLPITIFFPVRDTTVRYYQDHSIANAFHEMDNIILPEMNIHAMGRKRVAAIAKAFALSKHSNGSKVELSEQANRALSLIKHITLRFSRFESKNNSSYRLADIWHWLDGLGNGDLRSILDRFRFAISSYHMLDHNFSKGDAGDTLLDWGSESAADQLDERINPKRFKTSLLNCDQPYFDERNPNTRAVNLFDAGNKSVPGNYLIRLKLLQRLSPLGVFSINEVFTKTINECSEALKPLVSQSFNHFLQKGVLLLEGNSNNNIPFEVSGAAYDWRALDAVAYVGPNGKLHLEKLIFDDVYLDEMKFATDFSSETYRRIFLDVEEAVRAFNDFANSPPKLLESHINSSIRKKQTEEFILFLAEEEIKYSSLLSQQIDVDSLLLEYATLKSRELSHFHDN